MFLISVLLFLSIPYIIYKTFFDKPYDPFPDQPDIHNPNDFNLLRTEILVYLRQKNNEQAKSLMQNYASLLNQSIEKTQSDVAKTYLYGELEWVNNMKLKIDAL